MDAHEDPEELEKRLEAAEKMKLDIDQLDQHVQYQLAARNKTCKILSDELSQLRQKYGQLETGAALPGDEEPDNLDELVKKAMSSSSTDVNSVTDELQEEKELRKLQHVIKKKKAVKVKTMGKLEREMFRQQKLKQDSADSFEIDHDVDADDMKRIKDEADKESAEKDALEKLEAEVATKLTSKASKRDRMLAEGSLKSDQIKLLKDRIAFQEAERTDLERRLHLLEGQFEAEKQAREELEHVKDNLVVQRQEAEGGYKLLLNELKLTKGKYFDEKGKRIQTEGVAKALEKDRQVTESEKVDALKAKEQLKKSKEQLVQESMQKEKAIETLAQEKTKSEEEAEKKMEQLQIQLKSQESQSQEKIVQMSQELDAQTAKLREQMEDLRSKHILVTGAQWVKHCTNGKKEPRFIWVSDDLTHLQWQSLKKKARAGEKIDKKFIDVNGISKVIAKTFAPTGNTEPASASTPTLKAVHLFIITAKERSLTLEMSVYNDEDESRWKDWVRALQYLVRQRKMK